MSFKFDFFPDEEADDKTKGSEDSPKNLPESDCEQVFIEKRHFEKFKDLNVNQFTFLPHCPFYTPQSEISRTAADQNSELDEDDDALGLVRYLLEDSENGESGNSDLIPNFYEGGHKIWECCFDLCEYLSETRVCFENKKVLDLGCGCGLLGIFAFVGAASKVHFQDYNKEVLERSAIPNLVINVAEEAATSGTSINSRCQFWSGDWQKFTQIIASQTDYRYDVILTSETIYALDNYKKLHDCLSSLLDKNGTIYLSAKSYYFGVGGGTQQFITFVEEMNIFSIETVKTIDSCLKREILKMTFKQR